MYCSVWVLALLLLLVFSPLIGWIIGAKVKGRPFPGFLWGLIGPPGWVVVLLFYGGAVRCPTCAKMTPDSPPSEEPSGADLHGRRCGARMEGL